MLIVHGVLCVFMAHRIVWESGVTFLGEQEGENWEGAAFETCKNSSGGPSGKKEGAVLWRQGAKGCKRSQNLTGSIKRMKYSRVGGAEENWGRNGEIDPVEKLILLIASVDNARGRRG